MKSKYELIHGLQFKVNLCNYKINLDILTIKKFHESQILWISLIVLRASQKSIEYLFLNRKYSQTVPFKNLLVTLLLMYRNTRIYDRVLNSKNSGKSFYYRAKTCISNIFQSFHMYSYLLLALYAGLTGIFTFYYHIIKIDVICKKFRSRDQKPQTLKTGKYL